MGQGMATAFMSEYFQLRYVAGSIPCDTEVSAPSHAAAARPHSGDFSGSTGGVYHPSRCTCVPDSF